MIQNTRENARTYPIDIFRQSAGLCGVLQTASEHNYAGIRN
jgi:hypothetical protein